MYYPTNWRRMQIFDYKCHSNLPLDIQKLIILYSEDLWYNKEVNTIIKYWYAYIGKKIVAQYIYSNMEMFPIVVYPHMQNNFYVEPTFAAAIVIYIIDPLKYYNEIIYVCKILKGTEDIHFWRSFLEKVACGLKYIYKEDFDKIYLYSWLPLAWSSDDIIRLNKLVTINNYIVNLRNKFQFPVFPQSFISQTLMTLKKEFYIPNYFI